MPCRGQGHGERGGQDLTRGLDFPTHHFPLTSGLLAKLGRSAWPPDPPHPLRPGSCPIFQPPSLPRPSIRCPSILLCFLSTFIASQRRLDLGSRQVLLGPAVDHLERWQRLPVGPPGGRGLEEVTSGVPGASWCSVGEPGCIVLGVGGRASPPGLPLGHPLVHPVTGDSQGAEGTFLPKMSFPFTTLKEERALIWPAGWPPSVAAGTRGEGEGGTSRRAPLPSTAAGDPSSQAGLLQPEIHTRTCASHQPLPLHPRVDIPRAPTVCLALGGRKIQSDHPAGPIQNSEEFVLPLRMEGSQIQNRLWRQ